MKPKCFFETINSYGPTILRLGLAAVLFPHGAQKVLGWWDGPGFSGIMGYFTGTLHIPAALALLAIITEFSAPIALFFGFFTRLAALAIGVNITVAAILGGHLANGFFMNWNKAAVIDAMGKAVAQGEGFEYHILMATLAFGLVFLGGGKCAVDTLIASLCSQRR